VYPTTLLNAAIDAKMFFMRMNTDRPILTGSRNIVRTTGWKYLPINANVTVSGGSVYSASYQRDLIGRITHKTEVDSSGSMAHQYLYDAAGRLIEVKRGATTISSYVYDANGNRIGGFNEQGSMTATYDEQDRLTSYNGTSYAYNNHGDLVSKTSAGLTTQYVYDVLGNLMQVSLPGGLQVDYLIDGRNRRIGKKVGGTLRQGFLYQDQLNPIAELDGNNNVISRFVYGSKGNVPDYMVKGGKTYLNRPGIVGG
jgi:YD repeat-containing protein